MKKIGPAIFVILLLATFAWTVYFLYGKSKEKPVVFETKHAAIADIVKKTVASGSIVPRREVELKPRVSGILSDLLVEPGTLVEAGDTIAQIKIVPNVVNVNSAESRLQQARISFNNAQKEYTRNQKLFSEGVISESEVSRFRLDFELRQQERAAATSNLQLIRSGASRGSNKVSNVVRTTVSGMVISVPQKVGASVTEANNFNDGTTIATVADMNDMIFEGLVDESEVAKLTSGMSMDIIMGALDEQTFTGQLEYISPKGVTQEGAIQFQIRAALVQGDDKDNKESKPKPFVRSGYSANANIVLDRREQVLGIDEALLQFDKSGETFVEVETGDQEFKRRSITTGLSDGVVAEVLDGVTKDDAIKVPIRGSKSES